MNKYNLVFKLKSILIVKVRKNNKKKEEQHHDVYINGYYFKVYIF